MANIGPKGILRHIDNPAITILSDTAGAGKTWTTDSDASDADFARAVAVGKGLHYVGTLSANDNRMLEFCSNNLYFVVQEGHCEVEALVQFSAVDELAFNFGFNDEVLETGNTTLPMEINGSDVISANSASFVGFVYDIDGTSDYLVCSWVDDSTIQQTDADGRVKGAKIKMSGMAPTAAKWLYLKVELDDRGSGNGARATFLAVDHTGLSMERTFNTTLDRDVPLCYYFGIENRGGTGMTVYTKHNNWAQTIPDM